jgi:phosphate transport system ATP-binding protein
MLSTLATTEIYKPELQDDADYAVLLRDVDVYYGSYRAVRGVTIPIERGKITAFIGPSGCGKSTVLRVINRMNDLVIGARVEGEVLYRGKNLYDRGVDPVEVRRRIGMVFQKPNPFPKSIYDNVAYGPRLLGVNKKAELDEIVEKSLREAALWEEVKNNLKKSGLALSGGQQQRLCIARTIAIEPDVILMDEPASALDPIATQRIEQLMREELAGYTIVIVTHNMQQAERVSDNTCFFNIRTSNDEHGHQLRWGELAEMRPTADLFNFPLSQETNDYINGRFG